jgi:hypothetical protein
MDYGEEWECNTTRLNLRFHPSGWRRTKESDSTSTTSAVGPIVGARTCEGAIEQADAADALADDCLV